MVEITGGQIEQVSPAGLANDFQSMLAQRAIAT
jgi:hypothetical protein